MNFDVFYCCYGTDDEVPGSEPIQVAADGIWPLAQRVLAAPDDFFGVVDAEGTTLQIMVETDGTYWTEVPVPEQRGSHGATLTQTQLHDLLQNLPNSFTLNTVPGASFTRW